MKVTIINTKVLDPATSWKEVYVAHCSNDVGGIQRKVCSYCPFRFRCFTERDEFEITTVDLDDLSLRLVSGGDLLNLIYRTNEQYEKDKETKVSGAAFRRKFDYYRAIFFKVTASRDMLP